MLSFIFHFAIVLYLEYYSFCDVFLGKKSPPALSFKPLLGQLATGRISLGKECLCQDSCPTCPHLICSPGSQSEGRPCSVGKRVSSDGVVVPGRPLLC